MTNERRTEKRTKGEPWQPPRGIRYYEVEHGEKRFRLEWRVKGARHTEGFFTADDREIAARKLAEERSMHGAAVLQFDPLKWRRYEEAAALAGGVDMVEVVREWLELRQGTNRVPGLTVAQAVERYLKLRAEEKLSAATTGHLRKHLEERFATEHGPTALRDVTPDLIRGWLRGLRNPKTDEPMSELTKRHHRKDLNTFLGRAVAEGWILRNPCESVVPPKPDEEDVTVLAIDDAVRLFRENRDQPCIGRMALEAFGGLRFASAARLRKDHLNFAEAGIEMPGQLHKSGKRKYRQGQPENLWQWLRAAPAECWEMTQVQYRHAKREAFVRAKVEMPHNVLRHSFASYHLALHKNPPLTGYLMQHRNTQTTAIYEGVAAEADAKRYFAILP